MKEYQFTEDELYSIISRAMVIALKEDNFITPAELLEVVKKEQNNTPVKEGYSEETKGWTALFKDENEYGEYLKWRRGTPKDDWKKAFESEKNKANREWVFETNGHKWSNNNDECGDNYSSFKEGAEWAKDWIETNIINKPLKPFCV